MSTEFIHLPSMVRGVTERLDPFAVKRIVDDRSDGTDACRVYGFGFEAGAAIALPGDEVEQRVTEARTGTRGGTHKVVDPPAETFPHPHLRRVAAAGR